MKLEKEITVNVLCDYNTIHQELITKGFKIIEEYQLNDVYLVKKDIDLRTNVLEILKNCVLVRDIVGIVKKLVYKYKKYDDKENIIEQGKTECEIIDIEKTITFMQSIHYKELIRIYDNSVVYSDGNIELVVQKVNNKYIFIEMEDTFNNFNTIDEMIDAFLKYNLSCDTNNFFVKKAVLVFNDTYKK